MEDIEMKRCEWVKLDEPLYVEYHDKEWGIPVYDDQHLFEMLCLEGAQAGLSWWTILQKREGYRAAFDQFDASKIILYTDDKLQALRQDSRIVRNKLKIASVVRMLKPFYGSKRNMAPSLSIFGDLWIISRLIMNGRP